MQGINIHHGIKFTKQFADTHFVSLIKRSQVTKEVTNYHLNPSDLARPAKWKSRGTAVRNLRDMINDLSLNPDDWKVIELVITDKGRWIELVR